MLADTGGTGLVLYAHPFSSYCQKVLIALYANGTPFTWRRVDEAGVMDDLRRHWPVAKFPVLDDAGHIVVEATAIIEHLAVHHPGPVALIPADPARAIDVRMMDRVFDNHVSAPMQAIVADALRPANARDPRGVADARAALDTVYGWLNGVMADRPWSAGEAFSLADCAAAPALFYAQWAHPIDPRHAHLLAYRARLLATPAFARCVEEARPFRAFFPLGAPDAD